MLVSWQDCTISIKMNSWENCKILGILHWPHDATKTNKNARQLNSYNAFVTLHFFFNMCNYTRYGVYYAKELKNMEELYPGNKEILPVSSISVQAQERYPTRTAIDIRSE